VSPDDLVVTPMGVRFRARVFPATIGRGGIARDKREGDGATPAGIHRIVGLLFRPDRVAAARLPGWAVPIRVGDKWCDDPTHPAYNHPVRAPFGANTETLRRADPMYDVVLVTDWNWPDAVPGRGSAIFVHGWRRPGYPTAGCVAFRRDHLLWIAAHLCPGTRLIVRG
jgi:L,D-peptidoglycan transpeptidase YkuD (ErfK/YbiS/YcfS/YnhG family)